MRSREDQELMVDLALIFFMEGFLGLPQRKSMEDLLAEYGRVMAAYRRGGMSEDEAFHAANAAMWRALEEASERSPGDSAEEHRLIEDVKAVIAEHDL